MATTDADWILDTGAVFHMTGNKELLADYHEFADNKQQIGIASSSMYIIILGHGSLDMEHMKVPNVRYVGGMTSNIISAAQLSREHSLGFSMGVKGCYIMEDNGGKIVGHGRLRSGSFILDNLICVKDKSPPATADAGQDNRPGISRFDSSEAQQGQTEWILDTSASRTVTGNRKLLLDYKEAANEPPLVMVNGQRLCSFGHGSVNSAGMKVSNVGYVGETENLVSVAEFALEHSLTFVFEPKDCYILKKTESGGQLNVGRAQRRNGRYVLDYLIISDGEEDTSFAAAEYKDGPDPFNIFALSRFVSHPGPAVYSSGDYVTALPSYFNSSAHETRPRDLIMDSGASFHTVYDKNWLKRYPEGLNVRTPIRSISGVHRGSNVPVEGCGYMDTCSIKLDGIIHIPHSAANLISVGQMTEVYIVSVVFYADMFTIIDHLTGDKIGHGHRMKADRDHQNHYSLDCFKPDRVLCAEYFNRGGKGNNRVMWGAAAGPPQFTPTPPMSTGPPATNQFTGPAAAETVNRWPGNIPPVLLQPQSQEEEAGSSSGAQV